MTEDKVRENRLRRVAERRGLRLEKSRRRDPHARGFGGFMVIEPQNKVAMLGSDGFEFSATLDDVEAFLDGKYVDRPAAFERSIALAPAAARGDRAAQAEEIALLREELRKDKEHRARGGKSQIVFRQSGTNATAKKRAKAKGKTR